VTPTASPTAAPFETLDHFLCYKARNGKGEPRFRLPGDVQLKNQFYPQDKIVDIGKVVQFCNPVEVTMNPGATNEVIIPIVDPAAHLTCYKVKRPKPKIRAQVISSTDQLGQPELNVKKRKTTLLCVPSQEVRQQGTPTATPTATPTSSIPNLDHFELFRVKRTPGTPKFVRETVNLNDQFLDEIMQLKKPVELGVPTNKNSEGITNSSTHMTCYRLRAPRFQKQEVTVTNQFKNAEEQDLIVKRPNMLCVPSFKELITLK